MMVHDPTQMPPDAELETKGPGLSSDIVVIDSDSPARPPATTEPVHRVERKDYKTLLAQLRNG